MAATAEKWEYLPIDELEPGDTIEDPSNGAAWRIERHEVKGSLVSFVAGTFVREAAPIRMRFWAIKKGE